MNMNDIIHVNVHVPIEVLQKIFSYIDLYSRIKIKRVCKIWANNCFTNHGYILSQKPSQIVSLEDTTTKTAHPFQLMVKGQEKCTIHPPTSSISGSGNGNGNATDNGTDNATSVMLNRRTKGHLPAPHIFHESPSSKLMLLSYPNKEPDLPISISNGDDTSTITRTPSNRNMIQAKLYAPHQMALAIQFQRLQLQLQLQHKSTINNDLHNEIRIGTQTSMVHLQCLDLESICFQIPALALARIPAKKLIQVVDLTCLRYLERLSVKGCSKLKVLRVPHSLRALDASACTELREIVMSMDYMNLGDEYDGTSASTLTSTSSSVPTTTTTTTTSDGGTGALGDEKDDTTRMHSNTYFLTALNLNGCRSLTKASFFSQGFLTNVQELDMTSVTKLSTDLIVEGFSVAHSLKNISLRYIASDAMLHALAKADALDTRAGTGTGTSTSTVGIGDGSAFGPPLVLLDMAFSHVTDGPVEELVRRAKRLERCNLRGCKGISGSCYNQVPIHLSKVQDQEFAIDYSNEQKRKRKGDNMFFFVS